MGFKIFMVLLCTFGLFGESWAKEQISMVMSGGPVYNNRDVTIGELRGSGFNTLVVWTLDVDEKGDLNFNYEFPLVAGGKYIGDKTWPHFQSDMANVKQGNSTITRLEFSIMRDWTAIQKLIETQGTGPDSALYKSFHGLKKAFPGLDAISSNDEGHYHKETTVQFAVMLADLGMKFTLSPYRKMPYWTEVITKVNDLRPGTVDAIYVQGYDGGARNNPCDWTIDGIEAVGSDWVARTTKEKMEKRFVSWAQQCQSPGGWYFLYDDFVGDAKRHATLISTSFTPVN